jgi:mRNA-degrading endonuclease toxin of MazEF toxin-antitoxin module
LTAFESLERGDIIWASDPLSAKGRPLLILGAPNLPHHGTQLIAVLLSTKTYHEEALTLRDDDYEGDSLGKRSHVLPWSLATRWTATEAAPHCVNRSNSTHERPGLLA